MSPKKKKDNDTVSEEVKEETKPKRTRRTRERKPKETKPKYEFNYHDGITWHDFVGLFLLVVRFVWFFVRILLWPVYWVFNQNKKIWGFIDAKEEDRVMNDEERMLFESVPTIFTITGLVGGAIIGIPLAFQVNWNLDDFIRGLNTDFISGLFKPIGGLINFIFYRILIPIVSLIADIYDAIRGVQDPFFVFTILVILGIAVTFIWITISEKFGLSITGTFSKLFELIFGTPQKAYDNLLSIYRSFNRTLTEILVGKKTLETHKQVFFKKTLIYTSLVSGWTFAVGIWVGFNSKYESEIFGSKELGTIMFTAFVLMVAGFISGIIILMLITRWFDLMNRKDYLAPEFIKEPRSASSQSTDDNDTEDN